MAFYTFTVSGAPTTTITSTGISSFLINGNIVQVQNSGGALPAPLAAATNYYVISIATNTLSLSLTPGGAAITLTTNGSGTNQIIDAWLAHFPTGHLLSSADTSAMTDQDSNWPGPVNAGGFGLYNCKEVLDPSGNSFNLVVAAWAYGSAVQSIPNNAYTALAFNTEIENVGGLHSTSVNNSRFTAPVAGDYLVIGGCGYATNATGVRQAAIYKNGSSVVNGAIVTPTSTNIGLVAVSGRIHLAIGDYIEIFTIQTSGGALNTAGSSDITYGNVSLIRAR